MFNTIRENLRAFLRIPENLTAGLSSASASLPTAALGRTPPEVSFTRPAPVAPVAPVAAAPRFRKAPVGANGLTAFQEKLQFEARLKTEFGFHEKIEAAGMDTKARRKVLADFDRYLAARPLGKAAPSSLTENDEGQVAIEAPPAADSIGDIVTKLEECLKLLKQMNPDLSGDSEDEVEARAALSRGDKATALKRYDSAITALGLKIAAKKSRSALLAEPSSRGRAAKLTAQGFNADPVVASLNAALGRGPLADRASLALAPVAGRTPPARPAAVATTTSAPPDVAKIRSIEAQIAELDKLQRREGFTNDRNDKCATLRRQWKAEMKKFHVSYSNNRKHSNMTTITEIDPNLRFEHPRPPKVTAPSIDAALAEADEAGQRAAAAAAEENAARNDALRLSTRIEALRKKRDELADRLGNLERTDIPAHRAACEATIKKLLGISPLDQNRNIELNSSLTTLPALDAKAKLLPGIIKAVRQELATVIDELAKLESDGGR